LAAEIGLDISVCHYPPGTSKWNKIEHRLFSFVTGNWRGKTLTSYRTIVELIGATTTETGLKVRAEWDKGYYPTGTQITDAELAALPLKPDKWHGEWNTRSRSRGRPPSNHCPVPYERVESMIGVVFRYEGSMAGCAWKDERRRNSDMQQVRRRVTEAYFCVRGDGAVDSDEHCHGTSCAGGAECRGNEKERKDRRDYSVTDQALFLV
ncbi:MAG: hypothetical protein LC808_06705, partial [Actinobacteria bacterium]|nr:hypothetical protein [Actinomycetota bacterium]